MTNKTDLTKENPKKEISQALKRDFLNEKIKIKLTKQGSNNYDINLENYQEAITKQDKDDLACNYMKAFGIDDGNFSGKILSQLSSILNKDDNFNESDINFAYAFLRAIEPKDPIETMLATQMFGTHILSCGSMENAARSNSFEAKSEYINRATKLTRTFISQMEGLKKYRNKDGQKIKVEHVNINDGGKAVIGSTINNQVNNNPA